jgi:hypothetical protein
MNANRESLEKIHGKGNVTRVYEEIRNLGGFGDVPLSHAGGLDIAGVLSDGNTAISSAAKDRIAELTGVDRGKATNLAEKGEGGKSSHAKSKQES